MEQWGGKQSLADRFLDTAPSSGKRPVASNQQVILDSLVQYWSQAERKLHELIHNRYVPASNMTAAGKTFIP